MPLIPGLDVLEPSVLPEEEVVSRRKVRHSIGRLIIQVDGTGEGGTPQEGDDYVKPLKDRIASYVADHTKDNKYPIPAQGSPSKTFLTDLEKAGGTDAIARWREGNTTEMFSLADQDLDPEVRRVLQRNETNVRRAEVLMEVEGEGERSAAVKHVLRVLDENQADSPDRPHNAFDGKSENQSRNTGTLFSHQGDPGRNLHNKRFGHHGDIPTPPAEIRIKELKRFGTLMMLRGSGEILASSDLKTDETTWNNQNIAGSLVPSLTRLGQSVDTGRFGTTQLLQEVNDQFVRRPELHETLGGGTSVPSYGAPWNAFVPFTGLGGAPAAISCALLATTVAGLLKGLAELVVFAKGGYSETNTEILDVQVPFLESSSTSRRTRLGRYLEKPQEGFLDRLTGLVDIDTAKTEAPYFKALSKGIDVFFRLDQDTESEGVLGVLEGLGMTASNFVEEYGWFSVILRNLFSSTTDVFLTSATAAAQIVDPSVDVTRDTGLRVEKTTLGTQSDLNRVTGILNIVNTLNDSYLLKFMNILATIGDLVLSKEFSEIVDDPDDQVDDSNPRNEGVTFGFPGPGVLHRKGRISNKVPGFQGEIGWSGRNLPSMFLVPINVVRGAETFSGTGNNIQGFAGGLNGTVTEKNRLSGDDVEKIEEFLNATYMPFWFQDLRTNEVISFPAFLTNIQDQFEPDYEETEGYGRTGKTYAWKNTTRTINLEFMTVATSIEDFHQMWAKIDKLVTMVYPQYTRGRTLEYEGRKFIQPFSQVPSSTPLIRLRLGDLFRSNFSKFALARQFGVASGEDSFSLEGGIPQRTQNSDIREFHERLAQVRQRMLSGIWNAGETATLAPNCESVSTARRGRAPQRTTVRARDGAYIYPRISDSDISSTVSDSALSAAASQLGGGGRALTSAINARGGTRTDARLTATHEGNATIVGPASGVGGVPLTIPGISGGGEGAPAAYKVRISGLPGIYLVPTSALTIHEAAAGRAADPDPLAAARGAVPETPATSVTPPPGAPGLPGGDNPVEEFFSEEENPIFKSFASVRGSGLAGVIKNLSINWQDATWETTVLNARAPKLCTISIDFGPVHDINPGLDHNGFTTSPVYGVGKYGDLLRGKTPAETSTEKQTFGLLRAVDTRRGG